MLGPDEVLIERPDPDGRTQHVTVGRLDDAPEALPTTWLFEEGPELRLSDAVYCVCVSDPNKTDACARRRATASGISLTGTISRAPWCSAVTNVLVARRMSNTTHAQACKSRFANAGNSAGVKMVSMVI